MKIGNLDTNEQVIIIAELSANHGNDIEIAKKTIKSMKESGADVVKIQSYTPDTITLDSDNEYFQIKQGTIWDGRTLYDLYKEAYMPMEWTKDLFDYAHEIGIEIFSSPFDYSAVDILKELDSPAYKIASFEITDIPLIEYTASQQKPMIISTGIADEEDIRLAIEACKRVGNNDIVLLKCTSEYPADISDANLLTMVDMKKRFNVSVGLSDHSLGSLVPVVAASLGARIIEKHFILDSSISGPDSSFSMLPSEFKNMVEEVRKVERSLGTVTYELTEKKKNSRKFSRSLFVAENIEMGEILTNSNIRSVRPNDGLHPKYYPLILGKKSKIQLKKGTPMKLEYIEGEI